jgi:hypothetical protein
LLDTPGLAEEVASRCRAENVDDRFDLSARAIAVLAERVRYVGGSSLAIVTNGRGAVHRGGVLHGGAHSTDGGRSARVFYDD